MCVSLLIWAVEYSCPGVARRQAREASVQLSLSHDTNSAFM